MNKWLISIVGIVFLCVLFDLIYPKGKTNSLCKSIFGIFAIFVIIGPVVNFDFDNLNVDNITTNILIENINKSKEEVVYLKIEDCFKSNDIEGVFVRIDTNLSNENFEIDKIYIDTTNLVLTENITNINKYEVIANLISQLLKINKERIVVYG